MYFYHKYFYPLRDRMEGKKTDLEKWPLNEQYAEIRKASGLNQFRSLAGGKSQVLTFAANNYRTCFINNMWTPIRSRLQLFFAHLFPGERVKETLILLLDDANQPANSRRHTDAVSKYLKPPYGHFRHRKNHWPQYMAPYWRLSRFLDANNKRSFPIVPMYSFGRKYVQIDNRVLVRLINHWKLESTQIPCEEYSSTNFQTRPVWDRHFNF